MLGSESIFDSVQREIGDVIGGVLDMEPRYDWSTADKNTVMVLPHDTDYLNFSDSAGFGKVSMTLNIFPLVSTVEKHIPELRLKALIWLLVCKDTALHTIKLPDGSRMPSVALVGGPSELSKNGLLTQAVTLRPKTVNL